MKIRLRGDRGANVVEMALISTVLLLMVAGVVDVGRAFNNYIIVINASREGARQAARLPCVSGNRAQYRTAVVDAAIQEATGSSVALAEEDISISPDPVGRGCAAAGANIEVTVQFDFDTFMGAILGASQLPIQSATSMVYFGSD
jgi:Flp pilus assembly protein TadG